MVRLPHCFIKTKNRMTFPKWLHDITCNHYNVSKIYTYYFISSFDDVTATVTQEEKLKYDLSELKI